MQDALAPVAAHVTVGTGLAIVPIPEIDFVLQGAGAGALVGTFLVQRLKARGARVDAATIVGRWTLVGGAVGAFALIIDLVAGGVT